MKINGKVILFISIITFLLGSAVAIITYNVFSNMIDEMFETQLSNQANSTATTIESEDELEKYIGYAKEVYDELKDDEEYIRYMTDGNISYEDRLLWTTENVLNKFNSKFTSAEYFYYSSLKSKLSDIYNNTNMSSIYLGIYDSESNRIIIYLTAEKNDYDDMPAGSFIKISEKNKAAYLSNQKLFEEDKYEEIDNISPYLENSDPRYSKAMVASSPIILGSKSGIIISGGFCGYAFSCFDISAIQAKRTELTWTLVAIIVSMCIILTILAVVLVNSLLIKPIKKLTNSSNDFISSDKKQFNKVKVKSKDEIGKLTETINTMGESITIYLADIEEKTKNEEKMKLELDVASKIQRDILPVASFSAGNFDIYSYLKPQKDIGGDFYDYFMVSENKVAIVIADVSGKGIPAALFMMRGKAIIKEKIIYSKTLSDVFYEANNLLYENNKENLFITCFLAVIDLNSGKMEYINAGHNKLVVIRDGKAFELDSKTNFVLGGIEDFNYESEEFMLNQNDKLFFYTDGVTEAQDIDGNLFGIERLLSSLTEYANLSPELIVSSISSDLDKYSDVQFDDITMIVFEYSNVALISSENPSTKGLITVTEKISEHIKKNKLSDELNAKISIIIDELYSNKVKYGFKGINHPLIIVKGKYEDKENRYILTFIDNDLEFNPLKNVKEPTMSDNLDDFEEGGLGLFIVNSFATNIKYLRMEEQNILIIEKDLNEMGEKK